ncbi:hypothetical protein [Streptomyces sp. IBSBF 2950]|uniref:hypothetical protein n=1 Tax=Streptomyces sp. IBSBF 2950 TaxID=2903528 RepID=UPI002FDBEBBA
MTSTSRVRINLPGRRRDAVETPGTGPGVPVRAVGRPPAEPPRPADLLLRFRNAVGAYVDVLGASDFSDKTYWHCRGCREDTLLSQGPLPETRTAANDHATRCRAIELTAPTGS